MLAPPGEQNAGFATRDRFETCRPASQSTWQVQVIFQQLLREKSLVPKRSGISGNSSDISKVVSQNDISEFESCHDSQPVSSLQAMSGSQKLARHSRKLASRHKISEA
jgi:hypothetical protein